MDPNVPETGFVMAPELYILFAFLAVMNVVSFYTYYKDKRKAIHHRHRISEGTLLWLAAAGGSLGALLAMLIFHHKTNHASFTRGVPTLLLLHVALIITILEAFYGLRII